MNKTEETTRQMYTVVTKYRHRKMEGRIIDFVPFD